MHSFVFASVAQHYIVKFIHAVVCVNSSHCYRIFYYKNMLQFIHSSISGHLGCFQYLAIIESSVKEQPYSLAHRFYESGIWKRQCGDGLALLQWGLRSGPWLKRLNNRVAGRWGKREVNCWGCQHIPGTWAERTLRLSTANCGLSGSVASSQHGGLRAGGLPTWWLRAARMSVPRNQVEATCFFWCRG